MAKTRASGYIATRWIQHHLHGTKSPTSERYRDPRVAATVTATEHGPAIEQTLFATFAVWREGLTIRTMSSSVNALRNNTPQAKRDRTLVTSITPMCVTCQLIASRPCPARYLRTGAFPTGIHMAIALSVEATKKNAKIRS